MTNKIKAVIVATFVGIVAYKARSAGIENVSVSPFAAHSYDISSGNSDWGAGLSLGYEFNKYVRGRVQAVAYSNEDWGGSTVDEGSLLVEATLLKSANGGVRLYAVGGVDRDFGQDNWGFGGGAGLGAKLSKNLELFGESRVVVYENSGAGLRNGAGLRLSF